MDEIRVFNEKVPDGGFPFYAWFVGGGDDDDDDDEDREYYFACVTDDYFYLSHPLASVAQRIAESNRLMQEHPSAVFKNARRVDLRKVAELRCSKAKNRLELLKEDGKLFVLEDLRSRQCRKMFDDIRARRAPHQRVEEGGLAAGISSLVPLVATCIALVAGGLMTWFAKDAAPGRKFEGRMGEFLNFLNSVAVKLTFEGTLMLSAALVIVCLVGLIYLRINPIRGYVVHLR